MSSVLETQRALRRALASAAPGAGGSGAGGSGAGGCGAGGSGETGLPAAAISIHRNNMLHALTRALALAFPAVEQMVGGDFFEAMAADFARRTPPRSAWLEAYGDQFPAFIASFAPLRGLPYLADLARLEWAVAAAARVDPHPALSPVDLAAVDTESAAALHFAAHASLSLLASRFPVDALRRAALAADEAALQRLDLDAPVRLLVRCTRDGSGSEIIRLDEAAFRFTRLLVGGAALAEALQQVPEAADGRTLALHLAGASFRSAAATRLPVQECLS